ncbi:hypothetical protein EMCRGX_G030584 [Ephydatia muelleri]|eukprot:Em0010g840a
MADPTVEPAQAGPGDAGEDAFGVPHAHQVSDQLHLWILLPGIVLLLLAAYLVYKLLNQQTEREKRKAEKRRLKQEKHEKKKGL